MGKINLILGPMFSGKTSELIRRFKRYKLAGKNTILIKFKNDTRYDTEKISTHDNVKIDAIKCEFLNEIDSVIDIYDIICIDEIQFFKDASFYCDKWANMGKIVEACGLNGDYKREPFEQISLLIPKIESVILLTAIDKYTGDEACFTKRIINSNETILIGGEDTYEAVSRKTINIKC